MRICFRGLRFEGQRREELERIATEAGFDAEWLSRDDAFPASDPESYVALIGRFPKDSIAGLPNLNWVHLPHAGAESWVDENMYPNPDVVLTNSSGVFGIVISEYMLGAMIAHTHFFKGYLDKQEAHDWSRIGKSGSIFGSTVCILGTGDLGSNLARRVKALGAACVRGVSRTGRAVEGFDEVVTTSELATAVEDADFIGMTLPRTPETNDLIDAEVISHMKPSAFIVNCGRGNAIDEDALIAALREGRIAGAQLDVNKNEPLPADSPLWDVPNLIITPHTSAGDNDVINQGLIHAIIKENLEAFVAGNPLTHVVDRKLGY
ncbi:MAG: D-2-hydroxyacid dehydrogenase [Atopobiaceae bacterium]|nr:D-2-hydroxyacid dehydrogenase [Atopobiaceae bacterium]